jgi:hypothetical protein
METEIDMKPVFTPEDFTPEDFTPEPVIKTYPGRGHVYLPAGEASDLANAKLARLMESWRRIHWTHPFEDIKLNGLWDSNHTHTAYLAFVEELPRPECKHTILNYSSHHGRPVTTAFCGECGVELVAEWKEKK